MPELKLTFLNTSILAQLQLEEALVRTSEENWCLINVGSPPAIVLGISGKLDELVHLDKAEKLNIPLIRRFSGGGTVLIDPSTIFVSLIGAHSALSCPPFPQPIMQWTARFYEPLLKGISLMENDYAINDRKFGGNAQYLRKNRWLHHSSLLWDFNPELMSCLKMPKRRPDYRESRSHEDFLCRLCQHFSDPSEFIKGLVEQLGRYFDIYEVSPVEAMEAINRPHRQSTALIDMKKSLR